jgi:rare lipoprotein A
VMTASWYGPGFEGHLMACGLLFYSSMPVIAHRSYPLGTCLSLRCDGYEATGIVLDRGPWVNGRDLDISRALAKDLKLIKQGVAQVEVKVVGFVPEDEWREVLR